MILVEYFSQHVIKHVALNLRAKFNTRRYNLIQFCFNLNFNLFIINIFFLEFEIYIYTHVKTKEDSFMTTLCKTKDNLAQHVMMEKHSVFYYKSKSTS